MAARQRRKEKTERSRPTRRRRWLGAALHWGFVLSIWLIIAVLGVVVWYAQDLPDVHRLGITGKRPAVTLVTADGSKILSYGDLYGDAVRLQELPKSLPEAVLATEDRRFYSHFGIDLFGLARAMYRNVMAGRIVQGGSTITQQLAKNLFLTPERTLKRKIQEVLLAFWLEYEFDKDQILALYLNRVYFGAGTYGVEAASQRYFGTSARNVDLLESAILAGLLKAPSRLAPTRDPSAARARAGEVLDNMVEAGYLKQTEADKAKQARLAARPGRSISGVRYFGDWILDQVPDYVGHSDADLIVTTTLDPSMQRAADRVVDEVLTQYGAKYHMSQGALVAMTPEGAVRAMVGGRDYNESQYNRAVQALRQPGSAFKPIVYLAGLESGLSPDTVFVDRPIEVDGWRPRNYGREYVGRVTMREGLARSINTIAVQVAERAGRQRVIDTAQRLGIASTLRPLPSLALGANEVGVMELTGAYAAFANGGYGVLPYGIREIRTSDGRVLYRRHGGGPGRVIQGRYLRQLQQMLEAVIDEGSGQRAEIGRPAAGKTGTTQDSRDAWFIGYTAQLVAGVWLGNDDASPMHNVTGGGFAARIWRDFMRTAHQGEPVLALRQPDADQAEDIPITASIRIDVGSFVERILRVLSSDDAKPPDGRPRRGGGKGDYPNLNVN